MSVMRAPSVSDERVVASPSADTRDSIPTRCFLKLLRDPIALTPAPRARVFQLRHAIFERVLKRPAGGRRRHPDRR